MRNPVTATVSFLLLLIVGCSITKVPPEVRLAEEQALILRRAGAAVYAPLEYEVYRETLRRGRQELNRQEARFRWFRNYKPTEATFSEILRRGGEIGEKIVKEKALLSERNDSLLASSLNKIKGLRELSLRINGGESARRDLMKADIMLSEAGFLEDRGEYAKAAGKLDTVEVSISTAEGILLPMFSRYEDRSRIKKWRQWAAETIAESREKKVVAFIVNKSNHTLIVYRDGIPVKTYNTGLGRNGAADKLRAGDKATPEGRYKVVRKIPGSRYYRALLLNYPNREDMKHFIQAKEKGLIPKKAGIGGLIEIHGGGGGALTNGCISLENPAMERIFSMASVGTPVTIVGALQINKNLPEKIKGY